MQAPLETGIAFCISLNTNKKEMKIFKKIKPLSVNQCWQGKRFKTPKYKTYEQELLDSLPNLKLPEPPYSIYFEFGFSNAASDWDNPIKPLQDVLQKKYGFNDKDIFQALVIKTKVKKGEEYFKVELRNQEEEEFKQYLNTVGPRNKKD